MGHNEIRHVPEQSRFELDIDGNTAGVLEYALRNGTATMFHTEVFPQFGGQGNGAALVHFALETAREKGWTIVPACGFVRGYVAAHREYADLVAQRRTGSRAVGER